MDKQERIYNLINTYLSLLFCSRLILANAVNTLV